MTKDVVAVQVDEPFSHVESKMRTHHIRHLPVVNEQNQVVGIITQRDFYHAYSPRKTLEGNDFFDEDELDQIILKNAMTADPRTLRPNDTIAEVIKIMAEHKYGALPVVDEKKRLLGIVSQIDILKFIEIGRAHV